MAVRFVNVTFRVEVTGYDEEQNGDEAQQSALMVIDQMRVQATEMQYVIFDWQQTDMDGAAPNGDVQITVSSMAVYNEEWKGGTGTS